MKPITGAENEWEMTEEMCRDVDMMSVVIRAMRVMQYDLAATVLKDCRV
jgi:hypothetical protein